MNEILNGFAAKILPRLTGAAASFVVGEASKHGLTLDPAETTAAMIATYAFVHRAVSKYTNPGDATRSVLIAEDRASIAAPTPPAIAWARGDDGGVL